MTRGLYFLTHDSMRDLTIAFLNSLRTFEPNLPLCFIPYNDEYQATASLRGIYEFSIWEDREALEKCDQISRMFHGATTGQYRKLLAWAGAFDEFAYIDIDTIMLSSLDRAFALLGDYDVITGISNIASLRKYVWIGDVSTMPPNLDTAYAASTGLIFSKRGALDLDEALVKARDAQMLKDRMALICTEQPFLNYLIVTSGQRYTSLSELRKSTRKEPWRVLKEAFGGIFNDDLLSLEALPIIVHWAGIWRDDAHWNSATWRHFRMLLNDCQLTGARSGNAP
jgi:hypothetical protein